MIFYINEKEEIKRNYRNLKELYVNYKKFHFKFIFIFNVYEKPKI